MSSNVYKFKQPIQMATQVGMKGELKLLNDSSTIIQYIQKEVNESLCKIRNQKTAKKLSRNSQKPANRKKRKKKQFYL